MPDAMSSRLLPIMSDGIPAATSTFSMPRFNSPSDSASVFPHSWVTSFAISLKFASRSALRRKSGWMRSPAGVRRHACSAVDAAFTALATSAAEDSGAAASVSPVAGFRTGIVCAADAASHWPPTKLRSVSCPIIAAPCPLRYNDCAANDLSSRQRLITRIGLVQREPLRHHCFWPENALRGETNDLGHVAARTGAVGADDAQLTANEPGDLDRCRGLPGSDAHRHHAAAVADHIERLRERLRQTEHFEGDVDALAVSECAHPGGGVRRCRVDDVGGAQTFCSLQLVVADVDRDDL